jgi:hypothetical protein
MFRENGQIACCRKYSKSLLPIGPILPIVTKNPYLLGVSCREDMRRFALRHEDDDYANTARVGSDARRDRSPDGIGLPGSA